MGLRDRDQRSVEHHVNNPPFFAFLSALPSLGEYRRAASAARRRIASGSTRSRCPLGRHGLLVGQDEVLDVESEDLLGAGAGSYSSTSVAP